MKKITASIFEKTILPVLKEELAVSSVMSVPKLQKIVISCGLNEAKNNKSLLVDAAKHLESISGQKVVQCLSKKSIAAFKIREGMPIGLKVTLRRGRMYDFLSRFISVYVPRFRDFRGFSRKSFDGRGGYTVGIPDMRVFPEIPMGSVDFMSGVSVVFGTSAGDAHSCGLLLAHLGLPLAHVPVAKKE